MLKIGNVELKNPFFLAPLAGITDAPFRRLCKEQGAGLVYSEMVSCKGLYYNDKNTETLLYITEEEKPAAIQVFGSEPEMMAFAAHKLKERPNAILDINIGCPVPKVVKNGEGAALLKDPDLIYRLVRAAVENAGKPVTAKIRMGWDHGSINAVETALAIEAAGASAVAVHGRTREQYYNGPADWEIIARVKKTLKIPVIGNGGVFTGEDAISMMEKTGVDAVMIARGAMGNPWIFRKCLALWEGREKPEPPELPERAAMMIRQLDMLLELKGQYAAVREMRKHVGWYLKGVRGSAEIKRTVNAITDADEFKQLLETFLHNM